MKKTILRMIKCAIVGILMIVLGTSCVNEVISETSLFEGKEMAVKYDIDIINPMSNCRCIEYDEITVTVFIEGNEFRFMKQDIGGSIGNNDALMVRGDYEDLKEFAIAIKNGDDLIKFINKVQIILIITPSCLDQIRNEGQVHKEEIGKYRINN